MKTTVMQTFAIAQVTFRELIREKLLWSALIFAFFLLAISYALAQISIYEPARIALDFGASAVGLAGSLMAVIIGGGLIAREIRDRTLYLVLTKSIGRWQFVVGKLLGLHGVLVFNAILMYAVLAFVLLVSGGRMHVNYLYNMLLQFGEFFILASVGVFFSCISTPILASIFTAGVWLIGHAMDDVNLAVERISSPVVQTVFRYGAKVLPDLTTFNIKSQLSHDIPVPPGSVAWAVLYAALFCTFMVAAACAVFSRRDL